jgi:hypothetical protein
LVRERLTRAHPPLWQNQANPKCEMKNFLKHERTKAMPIPFADGHGSTHTYSYVSEGFTSFFYDGAGGVTQTIDYIGEKKPPEVLVQRHDGTIVPLALFLAERTATTVLLFEKPTPPSGDGVLNGKPEPPEPPADENELGSDSPTIVQQSPKTE